MTNDDMKHHLYRAILLLDAGLPLYEMQAQKERRRNDMEGGLREITCQQRAESVRRMVREVGPLVGYDADA